MLLLACSSSSPRKVIIETKIVKQLPPSILAQELQLPQFTGKTNQDLVNHIFDLNAVIAQCNIDKALLKSWANNNASQPDETR
jgi:hypothetical protein